MVEDRWVLHYLGLLAALIIMVCLWIIWWTAVAIWLRDPQEPVPGDGGGHLEDELQLDRTSLRALPSFGLPVRIADLRLPRDQTLGRDVSSEKRP